MDFSVDGRIRLSRLFEIQSTDLDRGHSLGDDDLLYILRVRECGI
ncbi:MAG: hypothetical protein ACLR5G_06920 [Eubacteriales bacterium]